MAKDRSPETGAGYLGDIEERIKRGLGVVGRIPLNLEQGIVPVANVFDATAIGYHGYVGKQFMGTAGVIAAVGGLGKVAFRAAVDCVITRILISNAAGAAGTFSVRGIGPTESIGALVFASGPVKYVEQNLSTWAQTGHLIATSNDVTVFGTQLLSVIVGALSNVTADGPWQLETDAVILVEDETSNQGIQATFWGYFL
jgi:hypothetical protein